MVAQSPLTKWRNHSLPMRARYGVSFVKSKSHIGILFIKWYFFCSCYSELRVKIILTFQQSVWKIFWTNSLKPGLQKYMSSMNGISRSEGLSQSQFSLAWTEIYKTCYETSGLSCRLLYPVSKHVADNIVAVHLSGKIIFRFLRDLGKFAWGRILSKILIIIKSSGPFCFFIEHHIW